MPFVHVKVAGAVLGPEQVEWGKREFTRLMAEDLDATRSEIGVLVEQVPAAAWSLGGAPVGKVAHVDATIEAGTATPRQKARFIADAHAVLRSLVGADLADSSFVVLNEVDPENWGHAGRTAADHAGLARPAPWDEPAAED